MAFSENCLGKCDFFRFAYIKTNINHMVKSKKNLKEFFKNHEIDLLKKIHTLTFSKMKILKKFAWYSKVYILIIYS
jgi:hypothetical protein